MEADDEKIGESKHVLLYTKRKTLKDKRWKWLS